MADKKISQLTSGAPAQAGDEYIVARSGANYKLTLTNIAASMPPIGATTPNTGAFTTVTATTGNITTGNITTGVFADGSASAPSVTNTGDTNTGVYFPAADEVAVTAGGTVAAAFNRNGLFFRNRIINGDMRIDQRNAGAAVTHSGTSNLYVIDRMVLNSTGTPQFSCQQVSDAPAGFTYSAKLTTTTSGTPAASDSSYFAQYIEGFNVSDLGFGTASAKPVTVSFWVKSSLTGTFGGSLMNGVSDRAYPFSYTISAANTWEYKTVTIPGDTTGTWATDNSRSITVFFDTGSGTNLKGTAGAWTGSAKTGVTGGVNLVETISATWNITGLQLETGSVATPFERRPYGTELMLCQRYFMKFDASTADKPWCVSAIYDSTTAYGVIPLPVTMRSIPTITFSGSTVLKLLWAGSSSTSSATAAGNATPQAFEVYGTYSGLTQAGSWMRSSGSNQWIASSAEL